MNRFTLPKRNFVYSSLNYALTSAYMRNRSEFHKMFLGTDDVRPTQDGATSKPRPLTKKYV
jgi:hypothetical protein